MGKYVFGKRERHVCRRSCKDHCAVLCGNGLRTVSVRRFGILAPQQADDPRRAKPDVVCCCPAGIAASAVCGRSRFIFHRTWKCPCVSKYAPPDTGSIRCRKIPVRYRYRDVCFLHQHSARTGRLRMGRTAFANPAFPLLYMYPVRPYDVRDCSEAAQT